MIPSSAAAAVAILVQSVGDGIVRRGEPVRVGVPLSRAGCFDAGSVSLIGPTEEVVALQATVLDRWSDGSIRWLLLDFLADHDGAPVSAVYRLVLASTTGSSRISPAIAINEDDATIRVTTGRARFEVARNGGRLFDSVLVDGTPIVDASRTGLRIADEVGSYVLSIERATVEDAGPIRAVVCLKGRAGPSDDQGRLQVIMRLHFFAGSAAMRCDVTLRNPRAAAHPGGFWELGDERSVLLRDASFLATLPAETGPGEAACSPEMSDPLTPGAGPIELFQASSGGAHWNGRNHVDRHGQVPLAFQGYRLATNGSARAGLRATPIVAVTQGPRTLALSMPEFWQNFPKAVGASSDHVVLRLFPAQHPAPHELQPGEQKTCVFFVAWGEDGISAVPLAWTRRPLRVHATPSHYCDSGVVPYLLPADRDPNRDYVALVGAAIDGDASFEQKREVIDEYGWRNFGDMYADHESVYYSGPSPVISHYNNQYDAIAGCARQFMRSGDWRWRTQMCELASHVVDVDLYHTDDDKAAYNHGLFWHTAHYADAGRSTHRSYPRAPGIHGGGPSAEHNFATGLLLHHFLTGEPDSREAVIGLSRRVVDMDDGGKTVFRWISRSPTGFASATHSPLYQGPGRGAGFSIAVLLDGFRLTGDRDLLEKAEALIRRCVHPRDDIQARQLLDAERRWSYTVFLHSLGRYLDEKLERDELDMMYSYARQTLVAYGRWMAEHERPYLDRREELEYPTETWVAQELWKSEVFTFAARYADLPERSVFLARADMFFRYAIDRLQLEPTRTMTRPMVLLLSRGSMHGFVAVHSDSLSAPAGPAHTFGQAPAAFVPQKERVRRRLIALAVAGALAVVAGLGWLVW